MADPDSAPAGRYAKQALLKQGLWARLKAKLMHAGDVRSAVRLLAMQTVDAAIVYETDIAATSGVRAAYVFDADAHAPIEYVGALIESRDTGSTPRGTAASRFLAFLRSNSAQAIWRRHGFAVAAAQTKTESP